MQMNIVFGMQPFLYERRLNNMKGKLKMINYIKIKTLEKIAASAVILNLALLAVYCYNYYIKF